MAPLGTGTSYVSRRVHGRPGGARGCHDEAVMTMMSQDEPGEAKANSVIRVLLILGVSMSQQRPGRVMIYQEWS